MKPREYPLHKTKPRNITIKNVIAETAGKITERGFVYVTTDPDLIGKKVTILIEEF